MLVPGSRFQKGRNITRLNTCGLLGRLSCKAGYLILMGYFFLIAGYCLDGLFVFVLQWHTSATQNKHNSKKKCYRDKFGILLLLHLRTIYGDLLTQWTHLANKHDKTKLLVWCRHFCRFSSEQKQPAKQERQPIQKGDLVRLVTLSSIQTFQHGLQRNVGEVGPSRVAQ